MLLKKLTLHNVRTYTNQTIDFPASSIMLSGDIGSGKSSILLAIEFALFGIMRGELSGDSILRKGANEGSVELHFHLNGKLIALKRSLKRSQRGITQTAGYCSIDGIKEELTPLELKNKVLELLGYPLSLLNQSKSLIYRYTVYTPQEELKRIIEEDQESRLDVLRKVFDMDKYKRIKENMNVYLQTLRDDIIRIRAKLEQLPEHKLEKEELQTQLVDVRASLKTILPKEGEIKDEKIAAKKRLDELEDDVKKLSELKQRHGVATATFEQLTSRSQQLQTNIQKQKEKIYQLKESLESVEAVDVEKIKTSIEQSKIVVKKIEEFKTAHLQKVTTLKTKIRQAEELTEKISRLDNCPLCLQQVTPDHKHDIITKEQLESQTLKDELSKLDVTHIDQQIADKQSTIEELQATLQKADVLAYKKKQLVEDEQSLESSKDELTKVLLEKEQAESVKVTLDKDIKLYTQLEKSHMEAKVAHETVLEKERAFIARKTTYETKEQTLKQQIEVLTQKIAALETYDKTLTSKNNLQQWIKEHFLNVIDVMEQHVMLRIQQDFNALFQEWFDFLIEDENMSARVDETFTPLIEQNGYEIEFSNLSGGEKSSVALAYRLALNKVINDVVSTIHTKDLIVLDEPTDGFSFQQLDRLKDVLEQLDMTQVILVSHEPKIESFVERVIRVEKHSGVSTIIS